MAEMQESITAKICAFSRAHHSYSGGEKIFDDYLAYDILGREGYEQIGQMIEDGFRQSLYNPKADFNRKSVYSEINTYISPITLSRAAFAESSLNDFANNNGECQYVICGAGMDTFTFRNQNPNIRIFELDYPDTQMYKLKQIKELEWNIPPNVHYVPLDFAKDDMCFELEKTGFNKKAPTFVAILGVTYYLTLSVFSQTIEKISMMSSPGSEIVFDYPDENTFGSESTERMLRLRQITSGLGEIMKQGFTIKEIEAALNRCGFTVKEHLLPSQIQQSIFDGRKDGQKAFENIHLVKAVKQEGLTI